jgi:hypothetical protein
MADKKLFIVAKGAILSHRIDGKTYREGEDIDLSHCTPQEIQTLKDMGKIVEKGSAAKAEEVKNG